MNLYLVSKSEALDILKEYAPIDKEADPFEWADQMELNQQIVDKLFAGKDLVPFDEFNSRLNEIIIAEQCLAS